MQDTGNLPSWPGAAGAYSRAYRITANMAKAGHATPPRIGKSGSIIEPGSISEELRYFLSALNLGDEVTIKWLNLQYARFDSTEA